MIQDHPRVRVVGQAVGNYRAGVARPPRDLLKQVPGALHRLGDGHEELAIRLGLAQASEEEVGASWTSRLRGKTQEPTQSSALRG